MRRKSSISMGPGASSLILIFVMLSLSVLAILTLITSRNDANLSERSAQVAEQIYTLYDKSEKTRAEVAELIEWCRENASSEEEYIEKIADLAEVMPLISALSETGREAVAVSGEEFSWQEKDGVYTLDCAVSVGHFEESGEDTAMWIRHNLLLDRAEEEDFEEWDW